MNFLDDIFAFFVEILNLNFGISNFSILAVQIFNFKPKN